MANHDGNISFRLSRNRIMCTPTGVSKGGVREEMVLILSGNGKILSGSGRPFSELNLHLAYLQARPDVNAVMHAHPPTATGFGVSGMRLDKPFLPEAVVSLGPEIPTVPLSTPGPQAAQAMAPFIEEFDALLLAGNGVITCGVDLEMAYLRMELVEHLAHIALVAHQLGGIEPLPTQMLAPLLEARKRAGLGPEARQVLVSASVDKQHGGARKPSAAQLETVVRAEISRLLRGE